MSLRNFCLRIFQHCPLLASFSVENHMRAFEEFLQYKTRVPVRGAILLNEAMDSTVLVKGWKKGANWSFPRGKINKDEDDLDCAIREVYEETGFDIRKAGLVPREDEVHYIEKSMREQQIRLYVFRNIPMDTAFQPKTRKEISKIEWYKLSGLPAFRKKGGNKQGDDAAAASNANNFYMVAPFLVPLKKWVLEQKKRDTARGMNSHIPLQNHAEEPLTEDDLGGQADAAAGPSNSPPAIETLEGATLELQRLLKVQPPSQGVQISPSTATPASHDKGEALMALLRQKSAQHPPQENASHASAVPHAHVPHTPADLTYVNPPEPRSPHYSHVAERLPPHNYQPPPNFPIPQAAANQAPPSGYFHYARPHVNLTPHGPVYTRNTYVNQGPPPRKEPILLHPQPLPPQVQQSLLTRHILPTPQLEAASQGYRHPPQYAGGPNPQPGHLHVNMPQPYQQQGAKAPSQLSGHKMLLLSVFKNDIREPNENKAPSAASPSSAMASASPSQSQRGSGPHTTASKTNNPAAQSLLNPVSHYAQPHPGTGQNQSPVARVIPRQGNPTDAHQASLLDMFKKGGHRSPSGSDSTVRASQVSDNAFAPQRPSDSPSFKAPGTAETAARVPDGGGSPAHVNLENNTPFRSVKILSHTQHPESPKSDRDAMFAGTQLQNHTAAAMNAAQSDGRNSGYRNAPSPRDRAFLRQGESRGKSSPKFSLAAQAASYPYGHSPKHSLVNPQVLPTLQSYQPNSSLPRRSDANPEQKQKLLSLFGKDQPPLTGFTSEEKGKSKEPHILEQARPRSRVASLASAGGDNISQGSAPTSRRGSGTPISPADRSFLLSYLESVSSGGRQAN